MKRFDQINMIPFIDIMLVLLAIVLTTATFISQGLIAVDLPKAEQTQAAPDDKQPIEIAIDAKNTLFFEGEALALDKVAEKLNALPKDSFIVLRIDKAAVFETFVQLIDILKAKQLNNLSIQAQQPS